MIHDLNILLQEEARIVFKEAMSNGHPNRRQFCTLTRGDLPPSTPSTTWALQDHPSPFHIDSYYQVKSTKSPVQVAIP